MCGFPVQYGTTPDSIGCRIVVDCWVKAEKISHEVNVLTFCLLNDA